MLLTTCVHGYRSFISRKLSSINVWMVLDQFLSGHKNMIVNWFWLLLAIGSCFASTRVIHFVTSCLDNVKRYKAFLHVLHYNCLWLNDSWKKSMWSYEVIVVVSSHDSFRPYEYDRQLILATCFASTQLMRLYWCCLDNVMKRFRLIGMSSLQVWN